MGTTESMTAPATVVVPEAPPPPKMDARGPARNGNQVWVSGNWAWIDTHWVWMPGHWETRPSMNSVWVPGHWDRETAGTGWVWTPGYWE